MSGLNDREALPTEGWFEPTHEKLIEQMPAVRTRFGEESIE
jgi:hypothetical protein